MEDATSKTKTVRVAACRLTPMISFPSCEACSRLFAGEVHDPVRRRQRGRDRRGRRHGQRLRLAGERVVGDQHLGPGAGADGGDQNLPLNPTATPCGLASSCLETDEKLAEFRSMISSVEPS